MCKWCYASIEGAGLSGRQGDLARLVVAGSFGRNMPYLRVLSLEQLGSLFKLGRGDVHLLLFGRGPSSPAGGSLHSQSGGFDAANASEAFGGQSGEVGNIQQRTSNSQHPMGLVSMGVIGARQLPHNEGWMVRFLPDVSQWRVPGSFSSAAKEAWLGEIDGLTTGFARQLESGVIDGWFPDLSSVLEEISVENVLRDCGLRISNCGLAGEAARGRGGEIGNIQQRTSNSQHPMGRSLPGSIDALGRAVDGNAHGGVGDVAGDALGGGFRDARRRVGDRSSCGHKGGQALPADARGASVTRERARGVVGGSKADALGSATDKPPVGDGAWSGEGGMVGSSESLGSCFKNGIFPANGGGFVKDERALKGLKTEDRREAVRLKINLKGWSDWTVAERKGALAELEDCGSDDRVRVLLGMILGEEVVNGDGVRRNADGSVWRGDGGKWIKARWTQRDAVWRLMGGVVERLGMGNLPRVKNVGALAHQMARQYGVGFGGTIGGYKKC